MGTIKAQDVRKNKRTARACGVDKAVDGLHSEKHLTARTSTDSERRVPEWNVPLRHQCGSEMFSVAGR